MNKMCDFDSIVIGGGMIGSSIAFGLAKQDEKVAMIDEGDNALRAARGNFGLIWVQGKGEKNSSYADLTLQSAKKWPRFNNELMALTKIDIGFEQKGGFDFCLNQEEFDERIILLKHIAENSHEQFSYKMFNHEELAKKLPKIGPEVVGASYSSWDGHVNPLLLLRSLHKGFQELGGKLLTHSVSDIKYNDSYFSVQTKNSVINSNKVILAAGFSNQNLAPKIGLKMSLFPQRGQILVTEKIKPFLDYPTGLIRQTNEGGLLLGDSHEDVGFDDGTNLQTMQQIAQRVTTIFPFLRDVKMIRAWGSLRILTDDRLPIYDYSKTCPGAYTVSSHSGVTLAAIHALDIASHIVKDGKLPISLNCFSAERFND